VTPARPSPPSPHLADVVGVKRGRLGGQAAGQVGVADDHLAPRGLDHLVAHGVLDVAAFGVGLGVGLGWVVGLGVEV